jgi:eukaryotic-like serine/threonine-protein kinase
VRHADPIPSGTGPETAGSGHLTRIGIAIAAAVYVVYLALLITCDVLKIAPPGFVPRFERGRVTVSNVVPGSNAARAGLLDGDRILRIDGQVLETPADWQRVGVHVVPSRPMAVELDRGGMRVRADVSVPAVPLEQWLRPGQRRGVLAFRLAQVITLGFALVVGFRRSSQPSALLGALLLASLATLTLAMPWRLAVFWNALPSPLAALLWVPFTTSTAVGPLLFAFAAVFPRRVLSARVIAIQLLPALAMAAWHLHAGLRVMSAPGPPTGAANDVVFVANVVYAGAAIALFIAHWNAASNQTDRRRIGVLMLGTTVSSAAAVPLLISYWRDPGGGVFATPARTLFSLAFLAMPASFAYAILRHRLFDVPLIVRQGLRYALARRSLDALIPLLGALLVFDALVHRDQPLVALVQSRWWWYVPIGATLLVVRSRREHWLTSLDRRFFRERYDAQRLLTSIASQVARAQSFEAVAPAIGHQIDEALHPTFVSVLQHVRARSTFAGTSGGIPESSAMTLPASLRVIGVLAVLRKPLALSLGDTAWVRQQLPLEERTLLLEHGIELLVPISGRSAGEPPRGLLVLGPRRSEEPYNQEDMDLLSTIAHAVGALLERSAEEVDGLAVCERCGRCYDALTAVCTADARPLTKVAGAFLINGRYRLERRLGRGGMGTVYSATDAVLERAVAVKVIRSERVEAADLAARFRHEARAAASFAHPHVARVYDFGVDRAGRPFLVMELLDGHTLRERLVRTGRMEAAEVLHVLRGVCSAVSAAHERGLVHRDLKPENIFLQTVASGCVPKVLDFGVAKALDQDEVATGSAALGTAAGVLVGTLEYMAPEQVAGDDVSRSWDVWALSVVAYEMLTGRHPFRCGVTVGMAESGYIAADDREQDRPMPHRVQAFFHRALSPDRGQRAPDADTFLADIERVLA